MHCHFTPAIVDPCEGGTRGTSETIDVKMNSGRGGVRCWNVGFIQFAAMKAFCNREKRDKRCYMLGLAVKR